MPNSASFCPMMSSVATIPGRRSTGRNWPGPEVHHCLLFVKRTIGRQLTYLTVSWLPRQCFRAPWCVQDAYPCFAATAAAALRIAASTSSGRESIGT
jgi:hypothetical protein